MNPTSPAPAEEAQSGTRRRGFFAGIGALGAAGVLGTMAAKAPVAEVEVVESLIEPPARGGGYQLTAHVQRYYDTTRV